MPVTNTMLLRSTIVLLAVGFSVVVAIVAASLWLVGRTDLHAASLIEQQQIRRDAFLVLSAMQDLEIGQRGYLLTQEDSYLDPYRSARERIGADLAGLAGRLATIPAYRDIAANLSRLIGERLAELDLTVDMATSGRAQDALAIVRTDRGKMLMDGIRSSTSELIEAVDVQVNASAAEMNHNAQALSWLLLLGGLVIVAVVGGSAWIAWRHTRDLETARVEVLAFNTTLEERVRKRTADLARANEEIQRFAYIVSHDLRAPLVNIMGFTTELETGLASLRSHLAAAPVNADDPAEREARLAVDTDMPEAIGFIRSSTGKMDGLINAILKLSREGVRKLARHHVDMKALLDAAADTMRHQVSENGGEIVVQAVMPDIISDRLALEQVFGNLVDNAVKYLDRSRPGRIVISGAETHSGLIYEVADNGRGIGRDDHERIFDLFRRAGSQDKPGEGIGLSHVRALVRRLGGDIELESELGRGTTFRVRLPRSPPVLRESA